MSRYSSYIFITILVLAKICGAQQTKSSAKHFSKPRIIQPVLHHGRTSRAISTTKSKTGGHVPSVTLTVPVDGQHLVLDLELNVDLVPADHALLYQEGGDTLTHKPTKEELDLCHYRGSVRGKPDSWAAVSTCHGVTGLIFDGVKTRYIQPAEASNEHYLYEDDDFNATRLCGQQGVSNGSLLDSELKKGGRYKRGVNDAKIQPPYKSDNLSRYVELVLVADYSLYVRKEGNIRAIHSDFIKIANIMNAMYTPLNIYIALVRIVVWNERDYIHVDKDAAKTLEAFIDYRARILAKNIPNDNAQLLTGIKFNDRIVGKAHMGPMCTNEKSGSVVYYAPHDTPWVVAHSLAHEMGHNFGMHHDEDNCECPDKKCIMGAYSGALVPVRWSSCSMESLVSEFAKGMDYCLRNKPTSLYQSTCGNGFVEPGEQCDCGLKLDGETNQCHACCHPRTCMLRSNATCGAGACCDLTTCGRKSAGTMCRQAAQECDLPEYCTGDSEFCPEDVYKMDTTPCGQGDNQAYCANGSCRSHTDQCRQLWGPSGNNSERCYTVYNVQGNVHGNCGRDENSQYKSCLVEDALCGLLQCWHLNDRLEFGLESNADRLDSYFSIGDGMVHCKTVMVDLGLNDVDPGLVPNGAKCGHEKMCLNQKCVSVAEERDKIAKSESSICPSNCSGYGVCNSKGHCHCDEGFSPPMCDAPGPGGSLDSGPATDPTVPEKVKIALYVIFLGIVPFILLVLFLIYYFFPEKIYVCVYTCNKYALTCCQKSCIRTEANKPNNRKSKLTQLRNSITFKSKRENSVKKSVQEDEPIHENVAKSAIPLLRNNLIKQDTFNVETAKADRKNGSIIYENVEKLNSVKTINFNDCNTASSSKIYKDKSLDNESDKTINDVNLLVKDLNSTEANTSPQCEIRNPKALRQTGKNMFGKDNITPYSHPAIKTNFSTTPVLKCDISKSHTNNKRNAENGLPVKPNNSKIYEASSSGATLPSQSLKLNQNTAFRKINKDDIHIAKPVSTDAVKPCMKPISTYKGTYDNHDSNVKPSSVSEVKLKRVNPKRR